MEASKRSTYERKLSVIVPVYNTQDYLDHLLADIQKQTWSDFEVLLIDDGSTDRSADICRKYTETDRRFHYSYQENRGVSAARNRGMEEAKGRYVVFLDADDRIREDCLDKRMRPLKDNPDLDLIIGRYQAKGDFEDSEELFRQSVLSGKKTTEELLTDCISAAISFYYGVVWNKVYRKDIIDKYQIRFDESLKWCEDFIFNMEYFRHVRNCYYLKDPVYEYCHRPNSAISREELIDDRLDFLRYQMLDRLGEAIGNDAEREEYTKKVKRFLIERIHGVLSERAKRWGIFERQGYHEWKKYMFREESIEVWKAENLFSELTTAEKIVWILMKIRLYRLIYIYYTIKSRLKLIMSSK